MPVRGLARRIQGAAERVQALVPTQPLWPDEEGWLAEFEQWGREGVFQAEHDFPVALAFYRDAIARARASTDPPFAPPDDFRPFDHHRRSRLMCWRTEDRFPDVCAGLEWLFEMIDRVRNG